jgi:hypothetical protein
MSTEGSWRLFAPWLKLRERVVREDAGRLYIADAGEHRNPRPVRHRNLAPHCWMAPS